MKIERLVNDFVDLIFSKNYEKWIVVIFVFALILRIFASSNISPVADEMVHGTHAIGVSSLMPLSTMTQGPLWFILTDISYKLFGINLVSARFLSILFGSLSVIVVYLLTSKVMNKKVGIIASLLVAFSTYHIRWASVYMDESMMFFVLLAAYFFIKEFKEKDRISIFGAVFLGIAALIKIIAGVFAVVFLIFGFLVVQNKKEDKEKYRAYIRGLIAFALVILLIFSPIISYNYFLYKSKGIVDLPFSMYFGINKEVYQGPGLAHGEGFNIGKLFSNLWIIFGIGGFFVKYDIILLIFGFLGIVLFFYKNGKKDFGGLFTLTLLAIPLLFTAVSIALPTHYTEYVPLFAIFASYFIVALFDKFNLNDKKKWIAYGIIFAIILFNMINLSSYIKNESPVNSLREFANKNINKNDLIISDSRIYNGITAWAFNDKNYLEAQNVVQILSDPQVSANKEAELMNIFLVECIPEDCGWGSISSQQDINQSMEYFFESFRGENSSGKVDIYDGENLYFRIYKTRGNVNSYLSLASKQQKQFFFYKIRRNLNPENSFDYYTVKGILNNLINLISYLFLYFAIIISFVSILIPFYLLIDESKKDNI